MGVETRVYSSTQNGAPQLTGQASSLKNLLHACLFGSGFGSVTPDSITRSGSVATLTRAAGHGCIDGQVIEIAGADQSEYNGLFQVEVISPSVLTFTVSGSPATPATGTITTKTPAVGGWAQRYDGTDKIVLYSADLASSDRDFRIDDSGTTTARIVGYESMTDVDTGTNPFPTAAQLSGGGYVLKSSTADTTARAWTLVANPRVVYLQTVYNGTNYIIHAFGDLISPYAGDTYHAFVSVCSGATHTTPPYLYYQNAGTFDRLWVARNEAATVGAVICTKRGPGYYSGIAGTAAACQYAYPSPITPSGVLFGAGAVKVEIQGGEFRGFMPGYITILNQVAGAIANKTVFRGVTGYADPMILLRDTYPGQGSIALSLGDW